MIHRRRIAAVVAVIIMVVVFSAGSFVSSRLASENARLKRDRQTRIDNIALLVLAWSMDDSARIVVDEHHRILMCTNGFVERTGWKREQLMGQNLEDILVPPLYRQKHKTSFDTAIAELKDSNADVHPIERHRIRRSLRCAMTMPDGTEEKVDIRLVVTPFEGNTVVIADVIFPATNARPPGAG